jgi:hypothetical protein
MKLLATLLFAALVPLAPARAALIDVDSPLGQATAVLDTSTGLEWLKVSATAGATPDQIFAQIAPGGLLEGYRYATVNELTCGLFAPQLGRDGCVYTGSTTDVGPVLTFMERFGKSFDRVGLFQPIFSEGQIPMIYGETWHLTRLTDVQIVDFDTQLANLLNTRPADHWLVYQVPEPSSLALIGIAAFALASRARRTRRTDGAS